MKNALHVEYPVNSITQLLEVWKQLEDGGMLRRLLGRDITILEVGYRTPQLDSGVQQFLCAVCSNLAYSIFYTVTYLKDIVHPGMKFKVKFADDETFPEKSKSTMTLQGVLMNLEVTDTKERLTFRRAFAHISGVLRGSKWRAWH